uniref:Uncharacterized protein n=1 Tax=Sphaerodactylus townsendi TaxID=933632 RepID=A0ACB8E6L2_9SAUR
MDAQHIMDVTAILTLFYLTIEYFWETIPGKQPDPWAIPNRCEKAVLCLAHRKAVFHGAAMAQKLLELGRRAKCFNHVHHDLQKLANMSRAVLGQPLINRYSWQWRNKGRGG